VDTKDRKVGVYPQMGLINPLSGLATLLLNSNSLLEFMGIIALVPRISWGILKIEKLVLTQMGLINPLSSNCERVYIYIKHNHS
jgi:hypothetical protein